MGRRQVQALGKAVPDRTWDARSDAFTGALYRVRDGRFAGKALIFVGGTEGSYGFSKAIAARFAEEGMSGLGLAYWNEPGTPKALSQIPVEYIEQAALALKQEGYDRIGIWGISFGSILAILAGICLPGLISSVVAVSPSDVCCEGISAGGRRFGVSAFTYEGKDIPWVPVEYSFLRVAADSLRRASLSMHACYRSKSQASKAAYLPVERIEGPILFETAAHDDMWDSEGSCASMMARLDKSGFTYPAKCLSYEHASHFLVPVKSRFRKLFREERRYPRECWESDISSMRDALSFLDECWP